MEMSGVGSGRPKPPSSNPPTPVPSVLTGDQYRGSTEYPIDSVDIFGGSAASAGTGRFKETTFGVSKPSFMLRKSSKKRNSNAHVLGQGVSITLAPKTSSHDEDFPGEEPDIGNRPWESLWATLDRYVIMPDDPYKAAWNVLVLLTLVYLAIILPIRIAFESDDSAGFKAMDIVVDILFLSDIILSFLTAFEDSERKVLVKDSRKIAISYLKGWFVFDVISTIPFHLISSGDTSSLGRAPKFVKLIRMIRIFKLLKLYRLQQFIQSLEFSPFVPKGSIRLIKLFFSLMVFGHFAGCFWYFFGSLTLDDDASTDSWIRRAFDNRGIEHDSTAYRYSVSLYWAMTTLTTVGFGDITPYVFGELAFTIIVMILGTVVFSVTTATVSSIFTDLDSKNTQYRQKMECLSRVMKNQGLPKDFIQGMLKKMGRVWSYNTYTAEDWELVFHEIPKSLAADLVFEINRDLIECSSFFREFIEEDDETKVFSPGAMESMFLMDILLKCRVKNLPQNLLLESAGHLMNQVYIVRSGKIQAGVFEGKRGFFTILETFYPGDVIGVDWLMHLVNETEADEAFTWKVSLVCRSKVASVYCVPVPEFFKTVDTYSQFENIKTLLAEKKNCRKLLAAISGMSPRAGDKMDRNSPKKDLSSLTQAYSHAQSVVSMTMDEAMAMEFQELRKDMKEMLGDLGTRIAAIESMLGPPE